MEKNKQITRELVLYPAEVEYRDFQLRPYLRAAFLMQGFPSLPPNFDNPDTRGIREKAVKLSEKFNHCLVDAMKEFVKDSEYKIEIHWRDDSGYHKI